MTKSAPRARPDDAFVLPFELRRGQTIDDFQTRGVIDAHSDTGLIDRLRTTPIREVLPRCFAPCSRRRLPPRRACTRFRVWHARRRRRLRPSPSAFSYDQCGSHFINTLCRVLPDFGDSTRYTLIDHPIEVT